MLSKSIEQNHSSELSARKTYEISSYKHEIQLRAEENRGESIGDIIQSVSNNQRDPFESLTTQHLQGTFMKNNFTFVDYRLIPIGQKIIR